MTRKLLVGAIAAGALTLSAGTALALSSNDGPTPSSAPVSTSFDDTATSSTPSSTTASATSTSSTPTSESPTSSTPTGTATPAPGGLSAADASRIVLDRMGGTVREVEREMEHGRMEWKVEVTAGDGRTYDVRVDAQTGTVTRVDVDDRGGDDRDDGVDDGVDDHGGGHGSDDSGSDDHGSGGHGSDDGGSDDHGGHGGDDN